MTGPGPHGANGKAWDFFKKVTVTSATFTTNPDITFNIKNVVSFSLVNEGTTAVEYSFDGTTLHGDMTNGTPTQALVFDNRRVSKIWFRTSTPGQTVRVEAWSSIG